MKQRMQGDSGFAVSARGYGAMGTIATTTTFDPTDIRNISPRFATDARAANMALVEPLECVAADKQATPAQIALTPDDLREIEEAEAKVPVQGDRLPAAVLATTNG